MFTISQELEFFLWSVICGVAICGLYDIFSVVRRCDLFSVCVCNICDAVFILTATAIMTFVIFSVTNGYIRAYEFFGAFCGAICYKFTLSNIARAFFFWCMQIFFSVFTIFFKILLTPFKFMYKIICSIIGLLYKVVSRLFAPLRVKFASSLHTFRKTLNKT